MKRIAESKGLDNLIFNSAFTDLLDHKIIKVDFDFKLFYICTKQVTVGLKQHFELCKLKLCIFKGS